MSELLPMGVGERDGKARDSLHGGATRQIKVASLYFIIIIIILCNTRDIRST